MPGGVTTANWLVFVEAASYRVVNDTLMAVDPTSVGDPISTPLRRAGDPTNAVIAYWGLWKLDDADQVNFKRAIAQARWQPRPTAAETTIYEPPTIPVWGTQRVYVFDQYKFNDPAYVMRSLGLDTLAQATGADY